jgi:D-galactarolactone cycloisomerase
MKITSIDTFPLSFPQDPEWGYSKGWVTNAPALLIEVHTDEGISGWGEGYGPPMPVAEMIRDLCEPVVIGADPTMNEALWSRLIHDARDFSSSGTALAAISAIDIACWDIKGKSLGVPVCRLLGGPVRTELECYASAVRYLRASPGSEDLADPADLATRFVSEGFGAIKVAVGMLDQKEDLDRVQKVVEAIPGGVRVMVDANQAYTCRQAVEMAGALRDLGVTWFEDPLSPDDIPGWRSLRSRVDIPLAGGETLSTRAGYRDFLSDRLLDIILPETGLAGGLTECKKIVDMAYAFGVECTPHGYASAVGTAAAIQLASALPYQPSAVSSMLLPFEFAPEPFGRVADLLVEPFELSGGTLKVPLDRPGLGIEIDRQALKQRTFTR